MSALGEQTRPNPSSAADPGAHLCGVFVANFPSRPLSPPCPILYHPIHTSTITIMAEYVKVEKIVPKFPPPAFGDIAKASNDVCLGCLSRALG